MLLNVGPSTAFFVSTSTGAIMETAARECDAADDRAGSWSAAEEKVDIRNSIPGGSPTVFVGALREQALVVDHLMHN